MKLILQEKSVHRFMEIRLEIDLTRKVSPKITCRQMRAMSMFGVILTNYQFLEKLDFYKKWHMVLGRTYPVSNFFKSVTSLMQKKRIFWIVLDCL